MKVFIPLVMLVGVVGVSCLDAKFAKLIKNFSVTMNEEERDLLHVDTNSETPTNPKEEEIERALGIVVGGLVLKHRSDNIDRPYEIVHQTCEKAITALGEDMKLVNVLFETNNAEDIKDNDNLRFLSTYYSICQHVLKSDQISLKEKISVAIEEVFSDLKDELLLDLADGLQNSVTEDEQNLLKSLRINTNGLKPTKLDRDESIHGIALTIVKNISNKKTGDIDFSQFEPVVDKISGICGKIIEDLGDEMKSVNVLFGADDIDTSAEGEVFRAINDYISICQYLLNTDPGVLKRELRADVDAVVKRGSY